MRLRRSERRLRGLLYAAADAFFVHDEQGRILDANRRACESLGYTRKELLTLNVADIEQNFFGGKLKELWKGMDPGVLATLEGSIAAKTGPLSR